MKEIIVDGRWFYVILNTGEKLKGTWLIKNQAVYVRGISPYYTEVLSQYRIEIANALLKSGVLFKEA